MPLATSLVGGPAPLAKELTRASQARLSRHGFSTVALHDAAQAQALEELSRPSIMEELHDTRARNEIVFCFAAYRAPARNDPLPSSIYFSYHFFDRKPVRTERGLLRGEGASASNAIPRVLVQDTGRRGRDDAPVTTKHVVDTSEMTVFEARQFYEYLGSRTLYVDVWDGDAQIHIGTAAVPLRQLLRQGRPVVKKTLEYDVVLPHGAVDDAEALTVAEKSLAAGKLVGLLQLVACNYGEQGQSGDGPGDGARLSANEAGVADDMNWRLASAGAMNPVASLDEPDADGKAARRRAGRPAHRQRARPLNQVNGEVEALMSSRPHQPLGGGGRSAGGRHSGDGEEEPNAITYDELVLLSKLFRDDGSDSKGKVTYQGALMQLLDVPNLDSTERALVREFLRLEEAGQSLDSVAQSFDRRGDQRIQISDLQYGMRALLPHFCGTLKERDLALLTSRMDHDSDGVVGVGEFVAWVRVRQPKSDCIEGTLKKLLARASIEQNLNVVDVLAALDRNASGRVQLDDLLQTLRGLDRGMRLEEGQVRRYLAMLGEGDMVDLSVFIARMGQKYDHTHNIQTLKDILQRVQPLEDVFATWDADGSGDITLAELMKGLESWGLLRTMNRMDADRLLNNLDKDGSGNISLRELFDFVGRDYDQHVADRIRETLLRAEENGVSLETAFRTWDADGSGSIGLDELKGGLTKLHTNLFVNVTERDVRKLLSAIAGTKDGEVTLKSLMAFVGKDYMKLVAAKLKAIVAQAEEKNGVTVQELFREWDEDRSGELSVAELEEGLNKLQVFDGLTREDVHPLLESIDGDRNGTVSFKEFMAFLGKDFVTYIEIRLQRLVAKAGISVQEAFGAFDGDGDGHVSVEEFETGLKSIQGFEDVTSQEIQDLVGRFDLDGDGHVSLSEFARVLGQGYQARHVEAKFVGVLRKATLRGLSLPDFFKKLDADGDHYLSVDELERGLGTELGSLEGKGGKFNDLTRDDIVDFVKRMDQDGNMCISESEFLEFGVKNGIVSQEVVKAHAAAAEAADAGALAERQRSASLTGAAAAAILDDAGDEQTNSASRGTVGREGGIDSNYDFSTDPDTRTVEKKLRRVAQAYQAATERQGRGGVDVEGLFRAYDIERTGSVYRAEFVNVLMQLGLSLLDLPASSAGGVQAEEGESARRRHMRQVARVKGNAAQRAVRLRASQPLLLGAGRDLEMGRSRDLDQSEDLALIKWHREGAKKNLVKKIIETGMKSDYHIFPRFGETLFFEHAFRNPFNQAERFVVLVQRGSNSAAHSQLELVDNVEQWDFLRRQVPPAVGAVSDRDVESDMFDNGPGGPQVMVLAHETVHIPFTYLTMAPPERVGRPGDGEDTVTINFVSASHGHVVSVLEVHIHPRPPIVHRTLRFMQAEDSIVKRCVRLLPGGGMVDATHVAGAMGPAHIPGAKGRKYVHLVDHGGRVVVEWRESTDGAQEILIKYWKLGAFPSMGDFYILMFDDPWRCRLSEIWHVIVVSRLRKDVQAKLGQASPIEFTVPGDNHLRHVRAYASNELETRFLPSSVFQLVPNAVNSFKASFTPLGAPGTRKTHVHLVDVDTKQLVAAWILTCVAAPPQVTKDYDVDVRVGEAAHKKISYENPWNRRRSYQLMSSDPNVMRPKVNELQIQPHGREFMRLYIAPLDRAGRIEVFLMVNDERGQNEDCFRVNVNASL